jgi:cysteine-rich repeat protein
MIHRALLLCLVACSSESPSTPATCGNGVVDSGEQCDDGNTANGDGCSSACTSEGGVMCGNGVLETGEDCDDGNTIAGDGCSAACATEPPPFDKACPRFATLPKWCVPLPGSAATAMKVAATAACGAGYFPATGADAFVVRELFPDTFLIKETNNQTGERPVMTLFVGQTKALLLDTGHLTESIDEVIAPFSNGKPVEVINTHLHGDHINANNGLNAIAIDTPAVRTHCGLGDASFDATKSAACGTAASYDPPNDQTLNDAETYRVVRVVQDGHEIDLGGRKITVLFTPGHSKTSVTLRDVAKRALYTGDTLYPDDEIPLIHPTGSNLAEYRVTAQRYAALEAMTDVVVGAHSQGTMPARVLGKFAAIVEDRANGGTMTRVTDAACDAGGFRFSNFPP